MAWRRELEVPPPTCMEFMSGEPLKLFKLVADVAVG
jgi:hypothetical protein